MNKFVNAALSTPVLARTENGMKAQKSTTSPVVDLFYTIGSARGKNINALFERAYQENPDLAVRIALWARDVRGGAGERQVFRDVMKHMEAYHADAINGSNLLKIIPEVGRWDDLLIFTDKGIKDRSFELIKTALESGNGLAAKWMPRKGIEAVELRKHMNLSPKAYRKTLVGLTHVVETAMCQKDYSNINYAHVPSLAMSRYMKAFHKNDTERFVAYRNALVKGETKINASAVYPYDVIKTTRAGGNKQVADAQWKALPDYMNDANVLPLVDVSGSMSCAAGGNPNVTCLDVSLSLGLYCADKNKGAFKDMFLTFSEQTEILRLTGSLSEKLAQMHGSKWGMNTNLHAAFKKILDVAKNNSVPAEDMPKYLLILSDMQFDQCAQYDDSAMQMIERKYEQAGYRVPVIVFWNLNSGYGNVPVSFNKKGVCLVSGFSPAIMKAVLGADMDTLSPESVVRDAVMIDRYNWQ